MRIPVLLLSFESQTVVYQLFDFHLRKFQKFMIQKFYFHNQTCQHSTWQWLVVGDSPRGQLRSGIGQARIHTVFHRFTQIGRIFHNKYIFSNKNAFQVEIWKMLDSPCLISTTKWKLTWWNNPAICKASSEENGTGQYPEPHGKGTLGSELKSTKTPWNFQF